MADAVSMFNFVEGFAVHVSVFSFFSFLNRTMARFYN